MLKVVVAVDSGASSKHAFDWALQNFLDPSKHILTIFTVVEPPIQSGYYYAASGAIYLPSFIDEQYEKATEEATRVVRDYQSLVERHFDHKLQCEMIVGRGEVRDEIVDFAEASKTDLLVVGSRGLGALKRTFVGSTSDYCVHHVHCPIIVVKPPQSEA